MHWSNPTGGASVSCYLRKSPCELLPSRRPTPPKCRRSSINCRPRGSRHSNISKFCRATRDAFSETASRIDARGTIEPCGLDIDASQCDIVSRFTSQDRSMQIRNLGGSGLRVSAVGLGWKNFGQRTDLETSHTVIHTATALGITLSDTADIY